MADIPADVIRVHALEATILGGGIKEKQYGYATDTKKTWTRTATGYELIGTALSTGLEDMPNSLSGQGGKMLLVNSGGTAFDLQAPNSVIGDGYKAGWHDQDDPLYRDGLSYSWNDTTKQMTISHSSGTVRFWTYNKYFAYTNSDPKLTATIPSTFCDDYVIYFDINGALQVVSSSVITTLYYYACVVAKKSYDDVANTEIATIPELHGASEPIGLRARLHNTQGTAYASGADLIGASIGDTTFGVTEGLLFDEDVRVICNGQPDGGSAIYPKYFFDGLNNGGGNCIKRGSLSPNVGLFDTEIGIGATGRVVYDMWNGTSFSPAILGASNYMCMFFFGANSAYSNINYTFALGQASYANISGARAGIASEVASLVIGSTPAQEAKLLYSFIINSSGQLQDVGDGTVFVDHRKDYRL